MRNNAPPEEPWLGRLAAPAADDDDAGFVRRVMDARDALQDEPWLDWLADNRIPDAPASPMFAARVAGVFFAGQTRRRVAGRIARACAAVAASAAVATLIWLTIPNHGHEDPAAGVRPALAIHRPPTAPGTPVGDTGALPLLPDLKATRNWLSDQRRQAAIAVNFTQKKASMLVDEYALPLRITGLLMGLAAPTGENRNGDGREKPQSHDMDANRLDFSRFLPTA